MLPCEAFIAVPSRLSCLQVKDGSQRQDEQMRRALAAAAESKRSFDQLLHWCEAVGELNQMNLVVLFQILLTITPGRSIVNASVSIEVMRMICRLKLHVQCPEEVALMKDQFDQACCKSLASEKAQRRSSLAWWQDNSSWARLVLPFDETEKALTEESDFHNAKDEIAAVIAS